MRMIGNFANVAAAVEFLLVVGPTVALADVPDPGRTSDPLPQRKTTIVHC